MTRCTCSLHSPFLWASYPRNSIFVDTAGFRAYGGKTQSQISSEVADTSLANYGRSNALPWMSRPGPVANPKKLAVAHKGRKHDRL